MLRRSFVHIPRIGPTQEKKLWDGGIRGWDELRVAAGRLYKAPRQEEVLEFLDRSEDAYSRRDLMFFAEALPRDQLFRLLPECSGRIAYLDIETTGLGFPPSSHSTTITFYYRGEVLQAVEPGAKLRLIQMIVSEAELLVTYFGQVFDVPFLERELGVKFGLPHLDLCSWLRRLGYKGGLKKIQKCFPDIPVRESMDIDGFDAVRLWGMHLAGVPRALETLLTYNAEDTIVLEPLLVKAFNLEIERMAELEGAPMGGWTMPSLRTGSCPEVYARLRGNRGSA